MPKQKGLVFSIALFLFASILGSLFYLFIVSPVNGFAVSLISIVLLITSVIVAFFMLMSLKTARPIHLKGFYATFGLLLLMWFLLAATFVTYMIFAFTNTGPYADPFMDTDEMGYLVYATIHTALFMWGFFNIIAFRKKQRKKARL